MRRRHFLAIAASAALSPRWQWPAPQSVEHPPLEAGRRVLRARPATLPAGGAAVWTIDDVVPAPTLRYRVGEQVRLRLVNELPEPTILHWHGLNVPEAADGHPRLAIPPGAHYDYDFRIIDPPGTYWYHPHPHQRTAVQTYRGIAGFFIIEDPAEVELGLPSRELALLLQDRRADRDGGFGYSPFGPDLMLGHLGSTGFVNGTPTPTLDVEAARYRLRLLNGCNARILQLRLDGLPLTLVGADGGLLPAPVTLEQVMLGPAERIDAVVDLTAAAGRTVALHSTAFEIPGLMTGPRGGPMMAAMGGGQGAALTFARFRVGDAEVEPEPALAPSLRPLPPLPELHDLPLRTFRFQSMMMRHTINGREFDMERVDVRVPRDRPEVWRFVNESALAHPVHVHVGSFRVLARRGGRETLMPWESGSKDTVLVWPGESVDVLVHFRDYSGRYLLHCHLLEHEDAGMMANFVVSDG